MFLQRLLPVFRDPIARKRLQRFRQHRRAWVSLWVLVVLYMLSLSAELICNDRPLLVRFEGRWYWPAFSYVPEDTFRKNGKTTRPDYHALRADPLFRDREHNVMIFAPVPFGPHTSIDPESLRSRRKVTLTFTPVPRVGHVNVGPGLAVQRQRSCGFFFGTEDTAVPGLALEAHWRVPPSLEAALASRFDNRASPRFETTLRNVSQPDFRARVTLPAFEPRARPPRTVRLTFRQPDAGDMDPQAATFTRDLSMTGPAPPVWKALTNEERERLLNHVRDRFSGLVVPRPLETGGQRYLLSATANDITWPHAPVKGHWMGIDSAGRDVFARILYGLRISMTFGFSLVAVSMMLGMLLGAVQGYYGGKVDLTAQRLIEVWSALPFLYVMILMGSVYGRSFALLLVCYGLFNWIGISYYMRGEFLRLRRLAFVDAARCLGVPSRRIIRRHVLPNALTPVITLFPFSLVGAVGALAALDYLGFGLPPPTPSWGELLHQAQQFRWAWWLIVYPFLALFIVMLLGAFVGEGVRDAHDPRPYCKME